MLSGKEYKGYQGTSNLKYDLVFYMIIDIVIVLQKERKKGLGKQNFNRGSTIFKLQFCF